MTSKEAAIQRLKDLKGMPLKAKLEHILTYYWFPIVVIIGLLTFFISYTVHLITLKETVLSVTCVNSVAGEATADSFAEEFAKAVGIDPEQYDVELSTSMMLSEEATMGGYSSAEVLITMIAAQSIDVLISDEGSMYQRFYQDVLSDLSQTLTREQQLHYQEYFLYLDKAVLEEVKKLADLQNIPSFPDPTKPELMKDPIPVAIRIPKETAFAETFFPDRKESVVMGFAVNVKNTANALAFLDYIMR